MLHSLPVEILRRFWLDFFVCPNEQKDPANDGPTIPQIHQVNEVLFWVIALLLTGRPSYLPPANHRCQSRPYNPESAV